MKVNKMKVATSALNAVVICNAMSIALADGGGAAIPGAVKEAVTRVLKAIQTVGVFVAIAMVMWAGFKFLVAGAGEKAKAKEMLVPIVIGAIFVGFAPTIATWLWENVIVGDGGTAQAG